MKRETAYLMALLLIAVLVAGQSVAIEIDFSNDHSSIKCTDGIVQVGEPQQVVLVKCGEPVAVTPENSDGYEVWIYQVGASKFMYYLGFLNGHLDRIVSRPCINNDPNCYDAR